jgi:hypothetical protein
VELVAVLQVQGVSKNRYMEGIGLTMMDEEGAMVLEISLCSGKRCWVKVVSCKLSRMLWRGGGVSLIGTAAAKSQCAQRLSGSMKSFRAS